MCDGVYNTVTGVFPTAAGAPVSNKHTILKNKYPQEKIPMEISRLPAPMGAVIPYGWVMIPPGARSMGANEKLEQLSGSVLIIR